MYKLVGLHEPGGEHLLPDNGWVLHLTHIAKDFNGRNFDSRVNNIVRFNWGYAEGNIPSPEQYEEFAKRCEHFVKTSQNIWGVQIGNEVNITHTNWEAPPSGPVSIEQYIDCYNKVYSRLQPLGVKVAPMPPATWNNGMKYAGNERGDWVQLLYDILNRVPAEWISIHAYTHGTDPNLIYNSDTMNPPFNDRHFNWKVYQDFMSYGIPAHKQNLPVVITEADQDHEWAQGPETTQWIKNAYGDIDYWNQNNQQQIIGLILYRWPNFDKFGMQNNSFVHEGIKVCSHYTAQLKPVSKSKVEPKVKPSKPVKATKPTTTKAKTKKYLITAEPTLNIRLKRSTKSKIVGKYNYGDIVEATKPFRKWQETDKGFIHSDYTEEVKETSTAEFKLHSPVPEGSRITQLYGENPHIYSKFSCGGVQLLGHNGIDWGIYVGTPIYAVDDGKVVELANDANGYGNYVKIKHEWGESLYAHLNSFKVVVGQTVTRGYLIANSGNTGFSTGPHLHFAIRVNPYSRNDGWCGFTNPKPYL